MNFSPVQSWALASLRILIGWHFLYEGLAKLWNENWSSGPYLMDSAGWFAGIFHSVTANPNVLEIVDAVNIWGLIVIGLALMLGLFSRVALIAGIGLLVLYYLSHPPFIGAQYVAPGEGNYLFVNKTVIEMVAMFVLLALPDSNFIGLDRFLSAKTRQKP